MEQSNKLECFHFVTAAPRDPSTIYSRRRRGAYKHFPYTSALGQLLT